MKRGFSTMLAALFLLLASSAFAQAQEMDPLLKILVENKVITMEQALSVQAEYARRQQAAQTTPPPAPAPVQAAVTKEEATKIAEEAVAKAKPNLPDWLKDLKFSCTLFISYQNGSLADSTKPLVNGQYPLAHYSQFLLKRGYLDFEKKITPWLDARLTPDIRQDAVGGWTYRTKFLYGKFHWKGNGIFGQPYVMAGAIPTPFIDLEDAIYGFRAQDVTFIERVGVMGSADIGLAGGFNLGPDLPDSYKKEVSSKHPGRWGSFMAGLYNGGGYDIAEKNMNKVAMARLSIRPLPDYVPGFQVTLFEGQGKGNVADSWATSGPLKGTRLYPDYRLFMGMLSYEAPYVAAYAQWFEGRGNRGGTAVSADNTDKKESGYSLFTRVTFPADKRFTAFVRYDSFDTDKRLAARQGDQTERWIGGLAWNLLKSNFLLLDYDSLRHSLPTLADENRWQLTLQLKF